MANSVDPDEIAHYELSHLDLHCLQKNVSLNRVKGMNYKILKSGITMKTSNHNTMEHTHVALDMVLFFFSQIVSIVFLFLYENIGCGFSLEAPW